MYALLLVVSALTVLAYAPGCRIDNKPRVTAFARTPTVVEANADGGPIIVLTRRP